MTASGSALSRGSEGGWLALRSRRPSICEYSKFLIFSHYAGASVTRVCTLRILRNDTFKVVLAYGSEQVATALLNVMQIQRA